MRILSFKERIIEELRIQIWIHLSERRMFNVEEFVDFIWKVLFFYCLISFVEIFEMFFSNLYIYIFLKIFVASVSLFWVKLCWKFFVLFLIREQSAMIELSSEIPKFWYQRAFFLFQRENILPLRNLREKPSLSFFINSSTGHIWNDYFSGYLKLRCWIQDTEWEAPRKLWK